MRSFQERNKAEDTKVRVVISLILLLAVFQVAAYLFSEGAEVDEASRLAALNSNLNTYQNLSSLDFDELLFFVS